MSSTSQNVHYGPPKPYQAPGDSRFHESELSGVRGRRPAAGGWSTTNIGSEDNLTYPDVWPGIIQPPTGTEPGNFPFERTSPVAQNIPEPVRLPPSQHYKSAHMGALATPAEGAPGDGYVLRMGRNPTKYLPADPEI